MNLFNPEFVLYDAGVDIHQNDELGKLKVDDAGLIKRDEIVLQFFKSLSIPIATVIGGGYSKIRLNLQRDTLLFLK